MKKILILIVGLFLMSLISATLTCDPIADITYESGTTTEQELSFQCTNSLNSPQVTLSEGGTGSPYFTLDSNSITMSGNTTPSQKTFTIGFDENAPEEMYSGKIYFSDGSPTISFILNVEGTLEENFDVIVFPTNKIITIQQGAEKTQNILLQVPDSYPRTITINSVDFNPNVETITFGDLNLGQVSPGSSIQIPIVFSGKDASTGTYQTDLSILATDSSGQLNLPSVRLQVNIVAGIQPITNFSLNDLPTCSIDATDLGLNHTYTLICSRTNPNIDIEPVIDYNLISGQSVSETSSQYIYVFKPIQIGTTKVGAKFKYKNAELGTPFMQEVRISPSGNSAVSGIDLRLDFYQKGDKKNINSLSVGDTTILVIDNKTGNIVPTYTIYLDGVVSNNTLIIDGGENYDIRVSATGYLDLVTTFNASIGALGFSVVPLKDFYYSGEKVNLTCDVNSTTYKVNDVAVFSPYNLPQGNVTITASKDNHQDENITLLVKPAIILDECNIDFQDWRREDKIVCDLSVATNWEVFHDAVSVVTGTTNPIEFKIEDYGKWEVKANGVYVTSKNFDKGTSWWKFWKADIKWYWWLIGVIAVIGIALYFTKSKEKDSKLMFAGQPPAIE